jgi:poly-gamma-glutamate synthesis protein (capsule biosynthesis protein)
MIGPTTELDPIQAPRPVIYVEPGLPGELLATLEQFGRAEVRDYATDAAARADPAVLAFVGTSAPPPGYGSLRVGLLTWVPVTAHGRFERTVSRDALRALLEGRVTDWSQLGGDPGPVSLVVDVDTGQSAARALRVDIRRLPAPEPASPVSLVATPTRPRVISVPDSARTVELVRQNRAAIGLVPPRALSLDVRTLAVDGCSVLSGLEPCDGLTAPVWLSVRMDASSVETAAMMRDLRTTMAVVEPRGTRLTAAGDIIIGRKVDERVVALRDYLSPFREVAPELRSADITVANVEMAMSDRITPSHDWKTYTFGTSTRAVEGLKYAGLDAVSLANNHSMNSGQAAFIDTLTTLDRAGIRYFGGGRNDAEAHRPAVVSSNGVRYAFLGYDDVSGAAFAAGKTTPGDAMLEPARVVADIRAVRQSADVVVPYFHWGAEYTLEPTVRQRAVARAAVDAGAALVLGSHPHWVQGVEAYHGALIVYSLGNFVFDQDWSVETQQGVVVRTLWLGTRLASFDLLPVRIYDLHQPRFLAPDQGEGRAILQRVWRASERYLGQR